MVSFRRYFLTIGLLEGAVLGGSAPQAQAQTNVCRDSPVSFAHCEPNSRNFQTVLMAVHGWNGDCRSTFGAQNQSIFNVIEEPFYDMDCFEYDSLRTPLDQNVAQLRERLKDLHAKGYRQVILVTHSTGGVIALRLLTGLSLNGSTLAPPQSTAPIQSAGIDGIRIKAIHAWATPINGLRRWVSGVGNFARELFSPETLPDLKAGSAYLQTLKEDLKRMNGALRTASAVERVRWHVPIAFYQGQNEDGIVHNIERDGAVADGWWPDAGKAVRTDSGHSHNVAASGSIGQPKYPAKLMELQAMLDLELLPRLEEVFPRSIAAVPAGLEKRQLIVVDGIASYAQHLFLQAYTPLADFLKRLVTDTFARSQKVDERIMDRFRKSIEQATLRPMGRASSKR